MFKRPGTRHEGAALTPPHGYRTRLAAGQERARLCADRADAPRAAAARALIAGAVLCASLLGSVAVFKPPGKPSEPPAVAALANVPSALSLEPLRPADGPLPAQVLPGSSWWQCGAANWLGGPCGHGNGTSQLSEALAAAPSDAAVAEPDAALLAGAKLAALWATPPAPPAAAAERAEPEPEAEQSARAPQARATAPPPEAGRPLAAACNATRADASDSSSTARAPRWHAPLALAALLGAAAGCALSLGRRGQLLLRQRARALDAREAALDAREAALDARERRIILREIAVDDRSYDTILACGQWEEHARVCAAEREAALLQLQLVRQHAAKLQELEDEYSPFPNGTEDGGSEAGQEEGEGAHGAHARAGGKEARDEAPTVQPCDSPALQRSPEPAALAATPERPCVRQPSPAGIAHEGPESVASERPSERSLLEELQAACAARGLVLRREEEGCTRELVLLRELAHVERAEAQLRLELLSRSQRRSRSPSPPPLAPQLPRGLQCFARLAFASKASSRERSLRAGSWHDDASGAALLSTPRLLNSKQSGSLVGSSPTNTSASTSSSIDSRSGSPPSARPPSWGTQWPLGWSSKRLFPAQPEPHGLHGLSESEARPEPCD